MTRFIFTFSRSFHKKGIAHHLVERYTVQAKIDEEKYGKVQALWKRENNKDRA